ncbi:MAG: hypothetical protein Q4C53_06315, partial [Clostridia bacterium]|nr:hypothetical protein [Clostridia bacterium]
MELLKLPLVLFFGSTEPFYVAVGAMMIAGVWGLFKKCGVPSWHALVPCLREYSLARCADRETEALPLAIGNGISLAIGFVLALPLSSRFGPIAGSLLITAQIFVSIVLIVLFVRVYLGL